jgi:nitroimidazol reductase NimA-like FMN-containing flavoprotein (pyridoxamine 5'-phosphate oxidase superfamily)
VHTLVREALVHETPDDLEQLQRLLDESYAGAGGHLREVITPERRLDAVALAAELTGMRLLVLATTTSDGRPIAGPVDGVFFRGRFYFGSSPESVRFRHIRRRPAVSATHLPGEELSVTVHGAAQEIDVRAVEHKDFRQVLLDVYVPRYGEDYARFIDGGPVYARIDARRMYTFWMPATPGPGAG